MRIKEKKILRSATILTLLLSTCYVKAQDGGKLFKQNCSACHKLEGTLVGPGLKGVREKWKQSGEEDKMFLWVKNPAELYNSGKSEMAKLAWEITSSEMTPQNHLTNEQITQIFDYVESDIVPEVKEPKITKTLEVATKKRIYTAEEKAKIEKRRGNKNRILFMLLVIVAIFLLLGIISISKTIQTFSILIMEKEDEPKDKKGKLGKGGITATVILLLMMLSPFSGYSMSLDLSRDGWFFVSNVDLIVLFIGDLFLLFILLDQKKTLKAIIARYDQRLVYKPKDEKPQESWVQLLTGAVAVEEQDTILLDHEYDGIRELDNNLPPWWVWSFVACILFAFIYLIHFHVIKSGDLQVAEYNKEVKEANIETAEYMSSMAMNVDESNVELLTESSAISKGHNLFEVNCIVCHKANGEGLIGPNLTDDYWINGDGDIKSVFKIIKKGTTNGMPEHESKLNPVEIQQVASFVLSMEFHEGKAPEGKLIETK